ncbi:Putative RNA pseudouridine synthase YlyB [Durusdinium trenchii]|uniref:RNA pseudouridine synthase YlyB n=1 Tax=Durusdinium trenchii TaxID=1381693 RepID=A0ABP0PRJ4_9DINO
MECHHWQIWRWLFWALEVQNGFRMCFALADERATVPRGAAADLLRAVAQAERFEAALLDCRKALQVCEASPREGTEQPSEPKRSSQLTPTTVDAPEWPENYGDLLRFPFGIADMKTLKEVARELWSPIGSAADLPEEVSEHGFRPFPGMRCTSEMVGLHPVGGVGTRWSAQLWSEAQSWCLQNAPCTGIMLYVGGNTMNCNAWCGRPQFCSDSMDVAAELGVERSGEWNLWVNEAVEP